MKQRKEEYAERKGDSRRPHGLKLIHADFIKLTGHYLALCATLN